MDGSADRRTTMMIWAFLTAGPAVFLAVAFAVSLPGTPDPATAPQLLMLLAGMVVVGVALSWLWAIRIRLVGKSGLEAMTVEDQARTRLIIAAALCEGPALFAVVVFMITRDALALLSFAIAFGALLAHFPGERHWARLCRAPGAADAPPNRLTRG